MSDLPVETREVLTRMMRAAVEAAARDNPSMTSTTATVTTYAVDPDQWMPQATVHIDGDPESVQHELPSMVDSYLDSGDRVRILFDPPHGGVIFGRAGKATPVPHARAVWSHGGE